MATYSVQAPNGQTYSIDGPAGATDQQVQAQILAQHPEAAKAAPKPSLVQNITGFMANLNRGLGIGDELAAGANTAGNLIKGKIGLGDVPADLSKSMAAQRSAEDSFSAAHPNVAALARGTGMAATAAVPAGDTANLFAQGNRAINAVRGATTAGLTAAGYAAADKGSLSERMGAAADAANPFKNPATFALGAAGGAMAPAASAAKVTPVPDNVASLVREGVQLTPGQASGGLAKTAEDIATSAPILGTAIQDARKSGLETFNRAAVNRSLAPIGEELPDHIATGNDAVAYAGDRLSAAYKKTLPEGTVRPDARLAVDISKNVAPIAETLGTDAQNTLQGIIAKRVTDVSKANDNLLDGKSFQKVVQGLDYEIGRYAPSPDPDHAAIGQALGAVKDAIESAAMRQNPTFAAAKNKIDLGWANIARVEKAAGSSAADGGLFTPAQYNSAIASSETKFGGRNRAMARGEALNQDFAQAAKAVLPSKVPDSGTATRGAIMATVAHAPGAVIGAVTGGGPGALAGMAATTGGLAAGAAKYSPKAMAAYNAALQARVSAQDTQAALAALGQIAQREPAAMALYQDAAARLSRAAGVAGGRVQNVFAQSANP